MHEQCLLFPEAGWAFRDPGCCGRCTAPPTLAGRVELKGCECVGCRGSRGVCMGLGLFLSILSVGCRNAYDFSSFIFIT